MASPLAAVERFFERLFERPAARLFQARVEPVNMQRAIERVIEAERDVKSHRVYVPSYFRVLLNAADLNVVEPDRPALALQLADGVRQYARAHGYVLHARPQVTIDPSSVVDPGDVRVFAVSQHFVAASPDQANGNGSAVAAGPANQPAPVEPGSATSVYPVPRPNAPRASLAVRMPGRPVARLNVNGGTVRVGRSADNDVVLVDDRVSRHHGQIAARLGMLVYSDLGSTNGSFVNGSPVTEIALGPGDVLQLGSSTVTIEPSP